MDVGEKGWKQIMQAKKGQKLINIDGNRSKEMEIDENIWKQVGMDGMYGYR